MDHLCDLCLVFVMRSRLFIAALWSVMLYCGFCHFPMWCLGSGVVLVCIDSSSLSPFLLYKSRIFGKDLASKI